MTPGLRARTSGRASAGRAPRGSSSEIAVAKPGLRASRLRLSGGRYFRPPTLAELFGDRGYMVGNEGLRPERGTSVDGGVLVDHQRGRTGLHAHAAGFATWSDALIQWQQSGPRLRPVNLDAARVVGLETGTVLRLLGGDLELTANYTLLAPVNLGTDPSQRGRPLPGRPRHQLFAQALSLIHISEPTRPY